MLDVSLYRCYQADKRISMEVYANSLEKALVSQSIRLNSVMPSSLFEKKWHKNSLVMRYLRYRYYPNLVKKTFNQEADIHHVADHGYAHLFPFLGAGKKYVSVHDLIPLLTWNGKIRKQDGQAFGSRKPWLNLYSLSFLKRYDKIIAISKSTANDLSQFLEIEAEKITVIPPVIANVFFPQENSKIEVFRNKYQLDKSTKWLMISGQEYYKNHVTSLKVLKELLRNTSLNIKIIKTGRYCKSFNKLVSEMQLQNNVKQVYIKDNKDLPLLYSSIDCLLFPSLYEGFGMPVTEALACGTPVVSSNIASLPEAGGELAVQCEPLDTDALAVAVVSQLDKKVKDKMKVLGPEWVKQFRENVIGRQICDLYQTDI